jgi:hypothetical protein
VGASEEGTFMSASNIYVRIPLDTFSADLYLTVEIRSSARYSPTEADAKPHLDVRAGQLSDAL